MNEGPNQGSPSAITLRTRRFLPRMLAVMKTGAVRLRRAVAEIVASDASSGIVVLDGMVQFPKVDRRATPPGLKTASLLAAVTADRVAEPNPIILKPATLRR